MIALLFLCALPQVAVPCCIVMPPEFRLMQAKPSLAVPPRPIVGEVDVVQSIGAGDSCDGVSLIAIQVELVGLSEREVRRYGFFVRPLSGVHDKDLLPDFPLAAASFGGGKAPIIWALNGITPDPDGHMRWTLEVAPVSRSGATGTPLKVCVATDGSCPKP